MIAIKITLFKMSESMGRVYESLCFPVPKIAWITQIDYDREIALVAIDEDPDKERMLGVARIIGDPDGLEGEIAVLIGDAWQGKCIGASLMLKCLLIAEQRGFKHIHGTVLRENTHMLALAKKLGFKINKGEDLGEIEIQIKFGMPELTENLASQ